MIYILKYITNFKVNFKVIYMTQAFIYIYIFYKKSFKSLKIHCFTSVIIYLTKINELVILTTSVILVLSIRDCSKIH